MNIVLDLFTIFISSWKTFFSCLVSVALFPSCAIILENKLDSLGRKSLVLRVDHAVGRISENIDSDF